MSRITIAPLSDTVKHQAEKAILTMVREANRKGGYMDIKKKLEEKEAGLSGHIYALAKIASKLCHSQTRGKYQSDVCVAYFQALCKVAENHLKEKASDELGHTIENVKDVLPVWPVFKSNIKRNMETGADPGLYDTLNAHTEARKSIEEQRASRAAHQNGPQDSGSGIGEGAEEGANTNVARGVAGQTKVTPKLAAVLQVLQKRIAGMTDDAQDALAERISEVLGAFAEAETETLSEAESPVEEAAPSDQIGEVAAAVASGQKPDEYLEGISNRKSA
jgi:ferritin-like metal-binding protein YciE